jgi:hypothetical protein
MSPVPKTSHVRYHASMSGVRYPKLTLKMGNLPDVFVRRIYDTRCGGVCRLGHAPRSLRDFQVRL